MPRRRKQTEHDDAGMESSSDVQQSDQAPLPLVSLPEVSGGDPMSMDSHSNAPTGDAPEDSTSSRGRRRRPTSKRAAMDSDSVTGSPSHGSRKAGRGRRTNEDEDTDPEPSDDGSARKTRKTDDGAVADEHANISENQTGDGGDVVLATLTDDAANQGVAGAGGAVPPVAKKRSRKDRADNLAQQGVLSSAANFQPMSMIPPGSVSPSAVAATAPSYSFNLVQPSSGSNNGMSIHMLPNSVGSGTEGISSGGASNALGSTTPTLVGMGGSLSALTLPPIPSQSAPSSPEKKRKAPLSYSRKDKSLGLLCENFLKLYEGSRDAYISLDTAATSLGVERRRIYDIVNILESVDLVSRRGKNEYTWHGFARLPNALQVLYDQAKWEQSSGITDVFNPEKLAFPTKGSAQGSSSSSSSSSSSAPPANINLDPTKPISFSSPGGTPNASSSSDASLDASGAGPIIANTPMSGGAGSDLKRQRARKSGDARREKSLGLLSQKFVQMFLMSDTRTISLEVAAKALLSDDPTAPFSPEDAQKSSFKSKVRRLYDIANVLSSLSLIEKVHVMQTRKPAFRWIGVLPPGIVPAGGQLAYPGSQLSFGIFPGMMGGRPFLMPIMPMMGGKTDGTAAAGSSSSAAGAANRRNLSVSPSTLSSTTASMQGMQAMPVMMKGPGGASGLSFAFLPMKMPAGTSPSSSSSAAGAGGFMPVMIPMGNTAPGASGSASSSSSSSSGMPFSVNPFLMAAMGGQQGTGAAGLSSADQQKFNETMQSFMAQYQMAVDQWQQLSGSDPATGGATEPSTTSASGDPQPPGDSASASQ